MKDLSVFADLSAAESILIPASIAKGRTYQRNEVLFHEGESAEAIYLIKKGQVKLSRVFKNGKEITLQIVGDDQIIGENLLYGRTEHIFTAEVVQEAFICSCTKEEFRRLVTDYPEIGLKIIKTLSSKLEQLTQRVDSLTTYDVKGRLINLFYQLSQEYGIETKEGVLIDLRLTHQDLAEFIDASRVMVTNTLQEIKGIKKKKRKFLIDNPTSLKKLVN